MASSLAGKRIVITGGAGFLGSFVTDRFAKAGAEIFVPRSRDFDLVEAEGIRRLYEHAKPEIVIHLAARVGGIGANRDNPGKYFYENLMMGVQLIHEGYRYGLEKFVAVGTICAYPKFAPVPFKEDEIWDGYPEETNAPYGLAKKMMLVQSQAYREQYDFNSVVLFPVNLYGPRDNFNLHSSHVIPAMIRKCIQAAESGAEEIELWGDGSPTREFLYAEDCAEGIFRAAESYDSSDPVNLGSGREISIKDLAQLIARLCDFKGRLVWNKDKPNGQPRRMLDTQRAKERFGFVAQTPFEKGLEQTIAWYRENRDIADT